MSASAIVEPAFIADGSRTAADRRRRQHAAAAGAGMVARGFTASALIVALPIVSTHLNDAELGVWTLLVGSVALLGFADLGLGSGLVNLLAAAHGRRDRVEAARAVTAGALGLGIVAAGGCLLVVAAVSAFDWAAALGVDQTTVPDLRAALLVFGLVVLAGIPSSLGQRIHVGHQQGGASGVVSAAGSLGAIAAVFVAGVLGASLPWFVLAMLAPPVVAAALETTWVLLRPHADLRPRRSSFEQRTARSLIRSGWLFFVLAVAGTVAYHSDAWVISRYLGPEEVTEYGVSFRLFSVIPSLLGAFLLPLWPAYGEALASGDRAWVARTLRRSLATGILVSAVGAGVLVGVARPLLALWTDAVARPSLSLLLALATWSVVSTASTALAMFLNAARVIRFQVVVAILMGAANLSLSIAFVRTGGVAWPLWASVISQTLVVLVPELLLVHRMASRSSVRSEHD